MKVNYIAIEREYGSGGTAAARALSEVCKVPCYGKEILEEMARMQGISVESIQKYEERATGSFLYSIYAMSRLQAGDSEPLTAEGRVFLAEQKAIQELSAKGRAIFLGHCASEVLKGMGGVIKVFIRCSDPEVKKERIIRDYGVSQAEAENTRKWYDRKRSNYYFSNTGRKWHELSNYDIVLDSAALGIDGCVDALKGLLVKKEDLYG